eukprot:11218107-Lingulodinium_polyedra.AAC.1
MRGMAQTAPASPPFLPQPGLGVLQMHEELSETKLEIVAKGTAAAASASSPTSVGAGSPMSLTRTDP